MNSTVTSAGTVSGEQQCAAAVFMVRPAGFGFNPETAPSNAFQSRTDSSVSSNAALGRSVAAEFDRLANALRDAGIRVIVGEDTVSPVKPDAVFPNNWVSFHRDGTVVVYPMRAPNRRLERRHELLERVVLDGPFYVSRQLDLSRFEETSCFLEGTGSLVLDRAHRIAYASLSPRTHREALAEFARQLDYDPVVFDAFDGFDETGAPSPVYHTNVLMCVGERFAVLCLEAIDPAHRVQVGERLRSTGHEVIDISARQMREFCGNVLQLAAPRGAIVVASARAWNAFTPAQRRALAAHGAVVSVDISTIERLGGGGVRCMLAEVHLPELAGGPPPRV